MNRGPDPGRVPRVDDSDRSVDDRFQDGIAGLATFGVDLLQFLVVLLVGWLIALLLRRAVAAVLGRTALDRLVERSPVGPALARTKRSASALVATFVFWAALLVALQIACSAFGPNPAADLLARTVRLLPAVAVALVLVLVAWAVAVAVRELVAAVLGGLAYGRAVAGLAYGLVLAVGVIAALGQVGIATAVTGPLLMTVLLTVAGILIVGVGGGLIGPMRLRWEQLLNRAERDALQVRAERARTEARTDLFPPGSAGPAGATRWNPAADDVAPGPAGPG